MSEKGRNGASSTGTSNKRYEDMTIVLLKDELKQRGLTTTGAKHELVERLKRSDGNGGDDAESGRDGDGSDDDLDETVVDAVRDENEEASRQRERGRCMLTFKDIEDAIDKFSGDDGKNVNQWIKEFDDLAKLCEWSSVHQTIYARRLLVGSARLFVNHEVRGKTWKDIKVALRSEFAAKLNSHAVHMKLQRRKKKLDETYHQYCYRMLEIASPVNMEISAVIQYIIDGIVDDEVNKTILYGAETISQLKTRLDTYELMKTKGKYAGNFKVRSDDKRKSQVNKTDEKVEVKRCYNCGGKNHLSAACPSKEKGILCFQCSQHGHIAASCPQRTKVEKVEKNKNCNATQSKVESNPKVINDKSKRIYKVVNIDNDEVAALFDSGSDISLMRAEFYVKIGAPSLTKQPIKFRGVGATENATLGRAQVKVGINGESFEVTFHVVPDTLLNDDVLIGSDFISNVDMRIRSGKIISISKVENKPDESSFVNKIDIVSEENEIDLKHIDNQDCREQLQQITSDYKPEKTKEIGIELQIVAKNEIPVYQRARRLAPQELKIVDSQIQAWLERGIIQPSYSNYASPVVLVKKKDGTTRLCVDYRKLNDKIIKVRYPLPIIEDQINRLQGARIFTTIDLENGFFHVAVAKDSRKYTAFVVPNGHYEFLRMPFGLSISPAYFQRYINAIFNELVTKEIVSVYMDDLIIPSVNWQKGLARLRTVLSVASEYGLAINWKKCQFLRTKVNYLGYVIEDGNVAPGEDKTKAIRDFPMPQDVKSVQSFLGLTGYFRKFVSGYATIARPLTDLIKKDVRFFFGDRETKAYSQLKEILCNRPVLRIYSPNADTELHTDASSQGFGAILMQRDNEDRCFHPVYFASVKTSTAEAKLHSYELEVLAAIKAIRKFRIYLIGIPFKIVTDCRAFALTLKKADCCARVARWALFLQDFTYTIEHRPGNKMRHVDALSRNFLPATMTIIECQETIAAKIRNNQLNDEETKRLWEQAESGKIDDYCVKNRLLHKIRNNEALIVVPESMQSSIIRHVHNRGHLAAEKTEKMLKTDYWFKGMRPKIEKYIQNCIDCILAERKSGKLEGWLHPIDKGNVPFGTYHIDHLGPLPSTKKKYNHIFAVIDGFTKFIWLYPVKTTNTAEVLDKLIKQSAIFGNPRRIVSDQGSAFTSHDFKEYCRDEAIEHVTIVTGIPRGNGQIERVNRTLIPLLTKLTMPNQAEWHKHVEKAQKYLNSVPSRSTGMSPFHLLFGTRMKTKEDPMIKEIIESEEAALYHQEREKTRELAREAIAKIQEENKQTYNKKRKNPSQYQEGDLVAIKRTQGGPGLKLAAKFLGPYRIKKTLRNERYVVEKIGEVEGPRMTSTATDHMKPWEDTSPKSQTSEDRCM